MATDNTTLSNGDVIRDVAKTATGAKVQAFLLDGGGGLDSSPETIWTMGAAAASASMPVSIATDQLSTLAKEAGNLATVATQTTASATAAGTVADAAYSGSGSSSLIAALKGIYAKLAGTLTASISGSVAVTGTFWQATQPVSLVSIPALAAGANTIGNVNQTAGTAGFSKISDGTNGPAAVKPASTATAATDPALAVSLSPNAGSTGRDYSAGTPTLPAIGANFGTSGPYANYYLTATIAAGARFNVDVENVSGSQIAVLRDDGTAAAGAAPANASVFALGGGSGVGSQGGSYTSSTFKGRLQVYSPITTAITFTGALTSATSGTLTSAWTGPTGSFYMTTSDGTVQKATFTNGSTSVTWSTAVTATASANAATAQVAAFVD